MLIYTNAIYVQLTIKSIFYFIGLAFRDETQLINIIINSASLTITIVLLLLEVLKK